MSKSSTNVTIAAGLDGYYAAPAGNTGKTAAVVVMMEAFGLTRHIRGICDKFAAAGIAALAPDIYHGAVYDYGDKQSMLDSIKACSDDKITQEIGASFDFLAAQPNVDGARLGITGFCMGGRFAFLTACRQAARVKAAVSYYGGGIGPDVERDQLGRTPPLPQAEKIRAPILLIYGAQDSSIAAEEHGRIAARLSELKKDYTLALYPNGSHGFCCEDRESYEPESARLALRQGIDFFKLKLG